MSMKKIVTDVCYEQHGNPSFWKELLICVLWGMLAILSMIDREKVLFIICCWFLAICRALFAGAAMRYRLIVDEKGIEMRNGLQNVTLTWNEIERVTIHNRVSFWKATGVTFYAAGRKSLYLTQTELFPLVKRYAVCPIEEEK